MKYSIEGENLPVLICEMEKGENVICEGGAMSWMSPNMKMETISNGAGRSIGRAFAGEGLFLNRYTALDRQGLIAFSAKFPGRIRAFEIEPGQELIAQRTAFLAATPDVELSVYLQKKISTGFFGGEGFVMQRLSGGGTAFLEFDGHVIEYELGQGEQMIVSTGYLVAMTGGCKMDIQSVAGMKNKFLGGEGLFNTVVTGPGRLWMHTMPVSKMARVIYNHMPASAKSN
ncbi:MAG: TIGR00266 family protein [Lachnospiraceae bacterium]|nr:TIGR00266 family protein [Lachnospiraceae bacterium]